jgi:hypothetical protein
MQPASNGSSQFQIEISPIAAGRVKELHRAAAAAGRGTQFLTALRQLRDRLRHNAHQCGEPLYQLHALGLIVRIAIEPPIVLHYAVHPQRRIAWFRTIDLLD